MVGFKAKARASAYFTKLGGDVGVFLWVGCGDVWVCEVVGTYMYMVRVVGVCKKGGNVLEGGGEKKLHHYIIFVTLSSFVHEKILSHQPDKDDQNWKQKLQMFKIKTKALCTI